MKRETFKTAAIVAIMTTGATTAFAGNTDVPILTATPAAPVVVPVTQTNDWTGFYAGGSLGYGDISDNATGFDDDGVTYGIHGGYDYDFGQFVLGGELEISGFDLSGVGVDVDSITRAKVRAGYDAVSYTHLTLPTIYSV